MVSTDNFLAEGTMVPLALSNLLLLVLDLATFALLPWALATYTALPLAASDLVTLAGTVFAPSSESADLEGLFLMATEEGMEADQGLETVLTTTTEYKNFRFSVRPPPAAAKSELLLRARFGGNWQFEKDSFSKKLT
jgi:hypothetical protein